MDFTIGCPKCGTKIDLSKRINDFVQQQAKKEANKEGSSAESVDGFRCRQLAKCMV